MLLPPSQTRRLPAQDPATLEDAKRLGSGFIDHEKPVYRHSTRGYLTPAERIAAGHTAIFATRDKELEAVRENRKTKRQTLLIA